MFFIIPIGVDVVMSRWPWMNWVIIAVTVGLFPFTLGAADTPQGEWLAGGGSAVGEVTSLFIHGGIFHLVGNMIFLWVFGNAVCAKVGNFTFAPLYIALGVGSGLFMRMFDHSLSIGASGAINGVVGMFLFWYAFNEVRLFYFYWVIRTGAGDFDVEGYWVILAWLAWDLLGILLEERGVAHWAHVGGLVVGFLLAWGLTATKIIKMDEGERSLLDVWREWRHPPKRKVTPVLTREALLRKLPPAKPRPPEDDAPIPLDPP